MTEEAEKGQTSHGLGACERCGKGIIFTKFTLCYECRRWEKEQVDMALEYLKDHRGASLSQVAEATGVDPDLVLKLVQAGRFETMEKALREKMKKLNKDMD